MKRMIAQADVILHARLFAIRFIFIFICVHPVYLRLISSEAGVVLVHPSLMEDPCSASLVLPLDVSTRIAFFMEMNVIPSRLREALVLALSLISAGSLQAGYPPYVPTLQPYQVASPDGTYVLEVKPTSRHGSGPGATTLTNRKTGEVVWKSELPFTFWQACVNDKGIVGGYAYSKGPMGDELLSSDVGNFFVRILDEKGGVVYEETTRRGSSFGGYSGYIPPPCANQLLFNAENDRMILPMLGNSFRSYRLSSGELLSSVSPASEKYSGSDGIRFIPGTPLLLLQDHIGYLSGEEETIGSRFCVMDERGDLVWSLDRVSTLPKDENRKMPIYRILSIGLAGPPADPFAASPIDPSAGQSDDPFAEPDPAKPQPPAPEKPVAPPPPKPVATFDLYQDDSGERVSYQVLKQESEDESERKISWSVAEVKRVKSAAPAPEEEVGPPKNFPELKSPKLGEFQLLRPDNQPLVGLSAFALGPDDKIHALDSKTGEVLVFDRNGKFHHLCKPGKDHPVETGWYGASLTVDHQGEVFVKLGDRQTADQESAKPNPEKGRFLHFTADGAFQEVMPASSPANDSQKWYAHPKSGDFIITDYTPIVRLVRRDSCMSQVVSLTHRPDGQWLDSIDDVAFAPDGTIAVLDSSQGDSSGGFTTFFSRMPSKLPTETINLFQADGTPIRTIAPMVGGKLTDVDFDGANLVGTWTYDPPNPYVYVFKATGEVVGKIPIDALIEKKGVDPRAFIVGKGTEILVLDCKSGRGFRYAMPK